MNLNYDIDLKFSLCIPYDMDNLSEEIFSVVKIISFLARQNRKKR